MPKKQVKQRRALVTEKSPVQTSMEPSAGLEAAAAVSPEERRSMIAEAAYFRAERRGFAVGGELEDWVQAEGEIDRLTELGGSHSRHSLRHM
jgi:hypothetical protein